MRLEILTAIVIGCCLWAAAPMPAHSQYDWEVLKGPIYNPHTESYFELRAVPNPASGGRRWAQAARQVERLSYKGVNGRLAIVRDLKTHEFLLQFPVRAPTWIGLHLDCSTGELVWVDGSTLDRNGFKVWDLEQWSYSGIRCKSNPIRYMGVFYDSRKNFRWRAAGEKKIFDYFFIEYPTGGR